MDSVTGSGAQLNRSKFLSYQQSQLRKGAAANKQLSGSVGLLSGAVGTGGASVTQQQKMLYQHQHQQQQMLQQQQAQMQTQQQVQQQQLTGAAGHTGDGKMGDMMNIQGRATTGPRGGGAGSGLGNTAMVPGVKYGAEAMQGGSGPTSSFPRNDLIPTSDEIPADGIIFARLRGNPNTLVVFRTPEERLRNPERLNLDRRQIETVPILEMELRLRLLNFQNNGIRMIQNLENLPNLIFLDLYNNKLTTLEGSVSSVKGLRVLMAGKNRISAISNLTQLRKLDVLDLHSNAITKIDGLNGLSDLRVLNLAGNKIQTVQNLASLQSLTELNLRRNSIDAVAELEKLPTLQRVFLSHNKIARFLDIQCLFGVKFLIELSLDGNPLSTTDTAAYRNKVIGGMPGLRHLDLQRITDEERTQAAQAQLQAEAEHNGIGDLLPGLPPPGADPNSPGVPPGHMNWPQGSLHGDMGGLQQTEDEGLASLARTGRVSSAQSLFDLELIAPNEKALVAVGDSWEWVQAKRLLVNVTEASLYHMKRSVITSKFSCNISWLPALNCLRLVNNELSSFKDVNLLLESFGSNFHIDHLTIRDNPISASQTLLRAYVIVLMPNLKSFNDLEISSMERSDCLRTLKPVIEIHNLAQANQASLATLNPLPGDRTARGSFANNTNSNRGGVKVSTGTGNSKSRGPAKTLTSGDKVAIEGICSDLCLESVSTRKIADTFEEDLKAEICNIFIDTVTQLRAGITPPP